MSCCPPNAEKYLAANCATAGQCITTSSGLEVYTTGSATASKKGVLIIPDIWGWNSGRTRNIADMFAEAGYLAVVPKLMVPPLEGGTDGDGLYPSFTFETDGAKFGPYMSQFDWKGCLDERIGQAVAYMQEQGADQLACLGFCWGGWVLTHALTGASAQSFRCGVICHPSVSLENMIFQRDVAALFQQVQRPILLLNAKGDPADYYADGAWFTALKANCPASDTHNYLNCNHGFVPRGDPADAEVQSATEDALTRTFAYIAANI